MKKEYKFTGSTYGASTIIIEDDKLTIKRKGLLSFLSKGLAGEKTIRINQITGTQYKPFKGLTNGYLQFILVGSQEVKGGLTAAQHDENSVLWSYKKQNEYAEEIINYINDFNHPSSNQKIIKQEDKYDQLTKLKKLLDNNAITEEEYNNEKKKILNN